MQVMQYTSPAAGLLLFYWSTVSEEAMRHTNIVKRTAVRVWMFSNKYSVASVSCSPLCFLSTLPSVFPSALRLTPWLPKQRPRFHSAPEHHGILVVIPAELPVLPPDPPLLRLPPSLLNQQRSQLLFQMSPQALGSSQAIASSSWLDVIPTQLTQPFQPPTPTQNYHLWPLTWQHSKWCCDMKANKHRNQKKRVVPPLAGETFWKQLKIM